MEIHMEKITEEFCKGKTLLFYPKTKAEVEFILDRAFEMGTYWINSGKVTTPRDIETAIEGGLNIKGGKIYTNQTSDDKANGIVCTGEQFDYIIDENNPAAMSDRQLLMTLFNKVTVLSEQVTYLTAEIAPKHLQKDGFKIK
jgi:hypothetical protein